MPKQILWVVKKRSTIFLKKYPFWWRHHRWCHNGIKGGKMTGNAVFRPFSLSKWTNMPKQTLWVVEKRSTIFLEKSSFWWHHHWWCHNGIKGGKMTEKAVFRPFSPSKWTNMLKQTLWVVEKRSTIFSEKFSFWWNHHWWRHNGIKGGKMTENDVFRPFLPSKRTNKPKQTLWVVTKWSTIFLKKKAFWWHHHWWRHRGMKGVKWLKIVLKIG